jgi:radical SAM protein with 4Fe4S-binding SPASM domain
LLHWKRLNEYLEKGDTSPIFMEVNPTNKCNLRCKWCITETARGKEEIEIDYLKTYFKQFKEMGGEAITFSGGGEPTLYPSFPEATISAKDSGLHLGLMTNGVFRKEYIPIIGNLFDWVRVSVDTLNPEKYSSWKGFDRVKRVKENIELLVTFPVRVGVNCNVGDDLSVEDAKELVEWVGTGSADYLQFRPVLPRYFMEEIPSINEKVWEYLDSVKDLSFLNLSGDKRRDVSEKNPFNFRSCEGHFFEPILDATGEIKVCMYHPRDTRFSFGSIYEKSLREIWNSEERKQAISFVRNLDYKKKCQMCCKLAEPNKLLDFLLHPEEIKDIHFL